MIKPIEMQGVTPGVCPKCGYEMDSASSSNPLHGNEVRPKPGDFSLCLRCGEILVFDDEHQPVLAVKADIDKLDLPTLRHLERAQRIIRSMPARMRSQLGKDSD